MRRKLHLVAAAAGTSKEPENTRLTLGGYIADILLDARHNAKIYHWIVQRIGSATIVYWGQEYSFEDARSAAQTCLEKLAGDQQKKA